jgi:hypothetical protein
MYEVLTDDQIQILYKIRKDGTKVEQVRSIQTIDGKLIILDKYKKNTFVFKAEDDIKWLAVGTQYIGKIANKVQIYIKPHYQELHRVIMTENYNRMSLANVKYRQKLAVDNIELDDKAILDNMLEYVGSI